ncbi:MAG: 4Fe-4S binding protein [Firmicutes bacterium]|nr:4Fe-4S binding protein [Bacillota bacterium]
MNGKDSPMTKLLKSELFRHGADIVGFGSLATVPPAIRQALPIGVAIAVKYPKAAIRGIRDLPTREYHGQYNLLNETLDALAERGAGILRERGFAAVPQTRAYVERFETAYSTPLPHKTVATRAGIGWIGKCALLVTEQFGSMVRLSSILTDAPLETAAPVDASKCGGCTACQDACPAGAVSGRPWRVEMNRGDFFDAPACRKTARERSMRGLGIEISLCGKCIEACPYTRRYLDSR